MANKEYKEWYCKNREETLDIFNYSQRRIDEIMLIVTIPALGVFLGYLEKLGYPNSNYMSFLMWSTVLCFLSVIFLNIFSLWTTVKASLARIYNLDLDSKKRQEKSSNIETEELQDIHHSHCWDNMTQWFNCMSRIVFIIACISLTLFVIFSAKN